MSGRSERELGGQCEEQNFPTCFIVVVDMCLGRFCGSDVLQPVLYRVLGLQIEDSTATPRPSVPRNGSAGDRATVAVNAQLNIYTPYARITLL